MIEELEAVVLDNLEFYQKVEVKDGLKFRQTFKALLEILNKINPKVIEIESFAGDYDLDEETAANGYRNVIYLHKSAVKGTLETCKVVQEKRESLFFRKCYYEKEVAAYQELLRNLFVIASSLVEIHSKADGACLFSEEGNYENIIKKTSDDINLESFYGRVALFHFPRSLRTQHKFLMVFLATYSAYYFSNEHTFFKLLRFPHIILKYWFNSEMLSRRLVNIFENAGIGYNKQILSLCESRTYKIFQTITELKVTVNEMFEIPPDPLQIFSEERQKLIDIPVPSAHVNVKPICYRLLSASRRRGMINVRAKSDTEEPSKYLIVNAHGGGWSTQTTRFHGSYLREWAAKLDVPIFSVEYSLAPEAPFPRAIEEIFYAYCWALKNAELLGSTGANIVFVGDSAGANLITACVIKCIEMGIQRPKGLFSIYGVFLNDFVVAPSRFCALMDVILPYSIYMRLYKSYEGVADEKANVTQNRRIPKSTMSLDPVTNHHHFSPHRAPDEILRAFPVMRLLSTNVDPCLDDSVEFARKLRKVGADVKLEVLDGLCHGFLNFSRVSRECHRGSITCIRRIKELLEMNL